MTRNCLAVFLLLPLLSPHVFAQDPSDTASREKAWKAFVAQQREAPERRVFELLRFPADNFGGEWPAISNEPSVQKAGRFEPVRIPARDGTGLDGWFFPVSNAKGTILVVHGWGSDAAFGFYQSRFLIPAGFQLLVYNHRSWLFSPDPQSYRGSISRDLEDLSSALDFMEARPDVDGKKVGILGFSYGAMLALLAAPGRPELGAVAIDASQAESLIRSFNRDLTAASLSNLNGELLKRSGDDYLSPRYDPLVQAARISPRPLLILHGGKDALIPPENSRRIFQAAQEPKGLIVFPESGHCLGMWTSDKKGYRKSVVDFFDRAFHGDTPNR